MIRLFGRQRRLAFFFAFGLLAVAMFVLRATSSTRASASSPSMCSPRVQQETVTVPQIGSLMAAVDPQTQPKVSADQAAQIAHEAGYDDLGGQAAATGCATLTRYTSASVHLADGYPEEKAPRTANYSDQLAWIISYEGICVPVFGPMKGTDTTSGCAGSVINVVVDATSGQIVEAFDNPSDDTPATLSSPTPEPPSPSENSTSSG